MEEGQWTGGNRASRELQRLVGRVTTAPVQPGRRGAGVDGPGGCKTFSFKIGIVTGNLEELVTLFIGLIQDFGPEQKNNTAAILRAGIMRMEKEGWIPERSVVNRENLMAKSWSRKRSEVGGIIKNEWQHFLALETGGMCMK